MNFRDTGGLSCSPAGSSKADDCRASLSIRASNGPFMVSCNDSNSSPILAAGLFLGWLGAVADGAGYFWSSPPALAGAAGLFAGLPFASSSMGASSRSSEAALAGPCGARDCGGLAFGGGSPGAASFVFSAAAESSRSAWVAVICWPWTSQREMRTASAGGDDSCASASRGLQDGWGNEVFFFQESQKQIGRRHDDDSTSEKKIETGPRWGEPIK